MRNLFTFVLVTLGFGWHTSQKENKKLTHISIINIEALASSESGSGSFNWCISGRITSYGRYVRHCGKCDMQMISQQRGDGYFYK